MRTVRRSVGLASLIVLLGMTGACAAATANQAGVWVEVSPGTVNAGYRVAVRASCGDNSNPTTVNSPAFGSLTLLPQGTLLWAEVTVPFDTADGRYNVNLTCQTGASATTTLSVISSSTPAPPPPTVGPKTGGGYLSRFGADGS